MSESGSIIARLVTKVAVKLFMERCQANLRARVQNEHLHEQVKLDDLAPGSFLSKNDLHPARSWAEALNPLGVSPNDPAIGGQLRPGYSAMIWGIMPDPYHPVDSVIIERRDGRDEFETGVWYRQQRMAQVQYVTADGQPVELDALLLRCPIFLGGGEWVRITGGAIPIGSVVSLKGGS